MSNSNRNGQAKSNINREPVPVPTESQLETANREVNKLFGLFFDITNPPANSTQMLTVLQMVSDALDDFTQSGIHESFQFMQPAWEHMSQLGERVSRYVQSEPKYRQDGCLLVASYPRLDRLHRDWEIQERKLQAVLTRVDVDVARIQNPCMTRQSAKVMIGLGPRLYLKKEYY